MALSADFKKELFRKLFHSLSLVYLAAYHVLGVFWFLWAMGVFIVLAGILETARLRKPEMNATLIRWFGGIHRPAEEKKFSGIFWTSVGCFFTVMAFGDSPAIITAAVLYLAFGDGVAALAGKAWGRHVFSIRGRKKSLEGSLACFVACLIAGLIAGLPIAGVLVGAIVATVIEIMPVPFDDNLWIPLAAAAAVSLF